MSDNIIQEVGLTHRTAADGRLTLLTKSTVKNHIMFLKLNDDSVDFFQYVTLRTRYSELTTLNSQYIKFIMETQRRLENDEVITLTNDKLQLH